MGAMFRSEEMDLAQLFIQPEIAYHVVSELGELGCVQFRDLNENINLFQREYASDIKRCDEMERQLRYVEEQLKKYEVPIASSLILPNAPNPRQSIDLEAHLMKVERDIKELSKGMEKLEENRIELWQTQQVFTMAKVFLQQIVENEFTAEERKAASQLGYIAGVIPKERLFAFEKMLFRVGRGNIYLKQEDIQEEVENPEKVQPQKKCVFIAFYQGDQLQFKVNKIATAFHAKLVDCPLSTTERNERSKSISTDLGDILNVISQSEDHIKRLLGSVGKDFQSWNVMVCKMKAIYHTLNYFSFDVSKKCLIAEGWVPTSDLPNVYGILQKGTNVYDSPVPSFLNILKTNEVPPTFNRTNKFTRGFQNLISSYGFANYRELNPALYTIITFPFLFAVMFGDLGHAIILVMFGAWMVITEKKILTQKRGEIFNIFFGGRYIILLMGIFSMYTGLLYNDIFSKSMNIFGSQWEINPEDLPSDFNKTSDDDTTVLIDLLPRANYKGTPYMLGMDPVWQSANNKIIFLNSFKMKLSIVLGVTHMLFGIILNAINHIHFKRYYSIFLDLLPKLLFFNLLFIYLAIMIMMKWIMYSGKYDGKFDGDTSPGVDTAHGSSCAPSVLIYFIGMMLFKETNANYPCVAYMFSIQETLQKGFLFAALLCIPVLLLGTPLYLKIKRGKNQKHHHQAQTNHRVSRSVRGSIASLHNHVETLEAIPENSELITEHEEPFSEVMVHQAIETIEFTLSTVSHTASYLRLWALSLAHSQLSDVLWSMVFQKGLKMKMGYGGSVLIYAFFIPWAGCTVGILVLMEGLSAFLHTLRLHWVEFMNKFYKGEGYDFTPFSFTRIFAEEEEG